MASVAILFIVATVFVLTRCCPCREDVSPIVMCSNSELIRNEYLQHDNVARGLYGDCLPSVGENSMKCFKWRTERCSNQLEERCSLKEKDHSSRVTNLGNSSDSTAILVSPGFDERRYLRRIFCIYNISLNCSGRDVDIRATERTLPFADQQDYLAFYINHTQYHQKLSGDGILTLHPITLPSNSFMAIFWTNSGDHNNGRFEFVAGCRNEEDVTPSSRNHMPPGVTINTTTNDATAVIPSPAGITPSLGIGVTNSITDTTTVTPSPAGITPSLGIGVTDRITVTLSSAVLLFGVTVPIIIIVVAGLSICVVLAIFCIISKSKNSGKAVVSTSTQVVGIQLQIEGFEVPCLRQLHDSSILIPGRHIQLDRTIGQGEFGLVYRSYLTGWQGRATAEVVAVKTLKSFFSKGDIEDLIRESEKMMWFNHPNVMSLIGICTDVGESPYIVMPFMANGSLLTYLKKIRPHFATSEEVGNKTTQQKLLSMCLQVAKGMGYLAAQRFIHRDLAARNCMIDSHFVIKISDFGLGEDVYARNYFKQDKIAQGSVRFPVKWMALESLLDRIFSEKTDVWSYGVTCWEIFSLGHTPYPTIHPATLVEFLQRGERLQKPRNASCTNQVYALMSRCWSESPEHRPSFQDIVCEIESLLEGVSGYLPLSKVLA